MILSSLSPLLILWAIRGVPVAPHNIFAICCVLAAIVPNLFLAARLIVAKRNKNPVPMPCGKAEDVRAHTLVYLLAILLPLYDQSSDTWFGAAATGVAFFLVSVLFYHLELYYTNIFFVWRGYYVFVVYPSDNENSYSRVDKYVLITRRKTLESVTKIDAYRITNSMYMEAPNG